MEGSTGIFVQGLRIPIVAPLDVDVVRPSSMSFCMAVAESALDLAGTVLSST